MAPMKVKKGMESKRSFERMPKTLSGRACKKVGWNIPISMPMKEKNKPTAPREKAAGYPINKNRIRPPNIMGAIRS
jgi:hypothetical protein